MTGAKLLPSIIQKRGQVASLQPQMTGAKLLPSIITSGYAQGQYHDTPFQREASDHLRLASIASEAFDYLRLAPITGEASDYPRLAPIAGISSLLEAHPAENNDERYPSMHPGQNLQEGYSSLSLPSLSSVKETRPGTDDQGVEESGLTTHPTPPDLSTAHGYNEARRLDEAS